MLFEPERKDEYSPCSPLIRKSTQNIEGEGIQFHLLFNFKIINALRKELKYNLDNDTLMQNSTKS